MFEPSYQQMPSGSSPQGNFPPPKSLLDSILSHLLMGSVVSGLMFFLLVWPSVKEQQPQRKSSTNLPGTVPLVMKGGDPHIRALMRTISASESNVSQPYAVIYGGEYASNLSRHPERCVTIVSGPNKGNCSTAAGRYQMLNKTWKEKAHRYHPNPEQLIFWTNYSFEAEYQDAVVYAWLKDRQAWGADIPKMLKQGKLEQVLRLLSSTWTSLGYGIETNSMSRHLPKIYQQLLREELEAAG